MTTPKSNKGKSKPGAEAVGDGPKMSKNGKTSRNSSSPTRTRSRSTSQNGSASETMPSATGVNPSSSSTSSRTASVFPFPSPEDRELEREGTITISFVTFGKSDQAAKTALQMVKDLQVRQHNVIHAAYNGKELKINTKWSTPVLDHEHDEPVVD